MSGHIVPLSTYYRVITALAVLLVLTVAASWIDAGPLNLPITLAIASAKAVLIVLFFMHVKYAPTLVKLCAAAGFVWLGILLVILLADYAARGWL